MKEEVQLTCYLEKVKKPYKVDSAGRVNVPTYLRNKIDIHEEDRVDVYTAKDEDGNHYLIMKRNIEYEEKTE